MRYEDVHLWGPNRTLEFFHLEFRESLPIGPDMSAGKIRQSANLDLVERFQILLAYPIEKEFGVLYEIQHHQTYESRALLVEKFAASSDITIPPRVRGEGRDEGAPPRV